MATAVKEKLVVLTSKSDPPNLFDGTTRLYVARTCPYAQRAWGARNYKRLFDIEIIPIDLLDRPKWYGEKVYHLNKVPALEHNGKVKGESLDLLEYIEENFEGPALFSKDPAKKEVTKELFKLADEVVKQFFLTFKDKNADAIHAEKHIGPLLDQLEAALRKYETEGAFFLGQFSAVDLVYAPFFGRFELLAPELLNYNIYKGRPKLENWSKAVNTVDAYTSTITFPPQELADGMKKVFAR